MKKIIIETTENLGVGYLIQNNTDKTSSLGTSVLLPNGYGPLKYISSLAKNLGGNKVYVPVLRGQANCGGLLNISNGKEDLQIILNRISKVEKKINIISHCSSLLYLVDLAEDNNKLFQSVNKIILYSYLANPAKHFDRFIRRSKKFNLMTNQTREFLKKYENPKVIERIPVPIHVIHPKTRMNLRRANEEELEFLRSLKNVQSIDTPEIGYEINNEPQEFLTKYIAQNFFQPLISNGNL